MTDLKPDLSGSGPRQIAARLDRLPVSRWHWKLVTLVGLATFFDSYEIFMSGILGSVLKKSWHLTSFSTSLLVGAPFFGMIFGAIFLGMLSDRFGRRQLFMYNLAAYSLLGVVAAFSVNVEMLIALRLVSGVFLAAELILVDTYLSELLPRTARGRLISVAYAIGFLGTPVVAGLGGLLIVKTHFLIDGWRWMLLAGGIGALLVFWLRRHLPESPRWLAERNRPQEADAVVSEVERTVERQLGRSLPEVQPAVLTPVKKIRFRAMFRPPYLKRTVMMWIFQITQTVGQYGFASLATLILVSKGYTIQSSLLYTAVSFIGAPVGALLAVPLVERVERKHLIIGGLVLIAVAGIVFGNGTSAAVIVIAGAVITVCNSVVSSAWHVYQAELFPTQVRSTAGGVAYSLSRLTAGLLPFGALAILDGFGPTQVFVVAAVITTVTCLDLGILGPRTNGRALEAVAGTGDRATAEPVPQRGA
ncbi:MFS transporter [Amycolatopsis sp. cmx-4-68]|uniref:MFS transporter n=1 Tax=Amycolatopsis sp. cmx-4-68 TaxID=2790938 RepID=UPI00397ACE55